MNPTDPYNGTNANESSDAPQPKPWEKQSLGSSNETGDSTVTDVLAAGNMVDIGANLGGAALDATGTAAEAAGGVAEAAGSVAEAAGGVAEAAGSAVEGAGSALDAVGGLLEGCGSCSVAVLVMLFAAAGAAMALFR